jgi:hypothetical protein
MWSMEAGRFFRFARRLPAYRGAMRAVAERLAREEEQSRERRGLAGKTIVPIRLGSTGGAEGLPAGVIDFG